MSQKMCRWTESCLDTATAMGRGCDASVRVLAVADGVCCHLALISSPHEVAAALEDYGAGYDGAGPDGVLVDWYVCGPDGIEEQGCSRVAERSEP